MKRALPALAFLLTVGCASTTTPHNTDADAGDSTDLSDLMDTPADLVDTMADTMTDTLPPDTTEVPVDTGPDGTGGGVVGDPCYSASQCGGVPGAGVTCLTSIMGYITFPGGYCSAVCTSAADCGVGAECVNLNDLGRYCLKRCSSPGECRTAEGYGCDVVTGAAGTFCIPPFSSPESDY
jgi:hypothetical protein